MPATHQLSPDEAGELLRVLRGSGGRHEGLRASAYETLKAIADATEIPDTPYIGLVTLSDAGIDVVCGHVAVVDFNDLRDPDCAELAQELDELAARIERDLSDQATGTVKDLRDLAQQRRVAALRGSGRIGVCTLAQLTAAVEQAGVDPADAHVNAAVVRLPD